MRTRAGQDGAPNAAAGSCRPAGAAPSSLARVASAAAVAAAVAAAILVAQPPPAAWPADSGGLTGGAAPSAGAAAALANAAEMLSGGRYAEAVAAYDAILADMPQHGTALRMKGVALSNMGEHAASIRHFYRAYQADRSDAVALAGIGVGLGNMGEYEEAARYLDKSILSDPGWNVARN